MVPGRARDGFYSKSVLPVDLEKVRTHISPVSSRGIEFTAKRLLVREKGGEDQYESQLTIFNKYLYFKKSTVVNVPHFTSNHVSVVEPSHLR